MADEGSEPTREDAFGAVPASDTPPSPWASPQPGMPPPPSGELPAPPPPPSAAPQLGQAPYGQPPYGQPPYGQPPYGQAPYGQAPYGQAQYGQPGYAQAPYQAYQNVGPANPYETRGGTVMVLGILSLVLGFACVIGAVLGPVAWIMGRNVKSEAEAAGWPEPSNNRAGRICGIIATVLMLIGIAGFVLFIILAAASGTSSSYTYPYN